MSSDLVKLISEPISTDNPSGTLLEDDPDLDKLNTEIRKLDSLQKDPITGEYISDTVDWEAVIQAGTEILTRKSKDLSIASYLCIGLFQQQGYSGLSTGIQIFIALLENFWETLYPPIRRMRGRRSAILRVVDKIEPEIKKREPENDEIEAIRDCANYIQALDHIVIEKFGDEAPNLSLVKRAIQVRALKEKVEETSLPPAAVGTEKTLEKPSPAKRTGTTAPATSRTDLASPRDAQQSILQAAAYLRESDPADPIPYAISRTIKWHTIPQLPEEKNRTTGVPGALAEMRQPFQNLKTKREWNTLLRQSEGNFVNSPLWFDLQRFIDQAMAELGESYTDARKVVREELAKLIQRLPGIEELKFQNGIPFADDETITWINDVVIPSVSSMVVEDKVDFSTAQSIRTSDVENLDGTVTEARRLASDGGLQDAILMLTEGLASASLHCSRREQFLWKLNLAKLCFENDRARLALQQLESLDRDIQQFSLEQWEPDLSVEVLRTLLQCKRRVMRDSKRPQSEIAEQTNELYRRLCQLDLFSAMALDTGG